MSPQWLGARGGTGKAWGSQKQQPDGLYHGACQMLSFHPPLMASFVGLVSPPSCLCALMPSDPGHVPQYCHLYPSLLAFDVFVYLGCPMQHPMAPLYLVTPQEARMMPSSPNHPQFLNCPIQALL